MTLRDPGTLQMQGRELLLGAEQQNRDLTDSEIMKFDEIVMDLNEHRMRNGLGAPELRLSERSLSAWEEEVNRPAPGQHVHHDPLPKTPGHEFRDVKTGEEFRSLSSKETLRNWAIENGRLDSRENCPNLLGHLIRGKLTGEWADRDLQQRAMSGADDVAGGYAVSGAGFVQTVDVARNLSSVMRAGATTFPMTNRDACILRVTGDPTAYSRQETTPITQSDASFGLYKLTSRTLGVLTAVSVEWLRDASNASGMLQSTISETLALGMDRLALRGSGSAAEPTGLRNMDSVNLRDLSNVAWDYDDLLNAAQDILDANGEPTAMIAASRTTVEAAKKKDGQGLWLDKPPIIRDLVNYTSNQIETTLGSGSDETEIYIGDFPQLMIGIRDNITIEFLNSGTVGDVNATSSMMVWVRAYLRMDVVALHEDHFTVVHGIAPAA